MYKRFHVYICRALGLDFIEWLIHVPFEVLQRQRRLIIESIYIYLYICIYTFVFECLRTQIHVFTGGGVGQAATAHALVYTYVYVYTICIHDACIYRWRCWESSSSTCLYA